MADLAVLLVAVGAVGEDVRLLAHEVLFFHMGISLANGRGNV